MTPPVFPKCILLVLCAVISIAGFSTAQDASVLFNTTVDLSVIEDPENIGEILQQPNAAFGSRIAASGDRFIATAYPPSTEGKVYVYADNTFDWTVEGALHESLGVEGEDSEGFGESIAIAGELAAVLQRKKPNAAVGVHLFSGGFFGWFHDQTLFPHLPDSPLDTRDWPDGDIGGITVVAMTEDTLVLGCPDGAHPRNGLKCGIVGVFSNAGGYWEHVLTLVPADPQNGMKFGSAVAVHKDTIAVGAPGAQVGGVFLRGAVYVFSRQAEEVTPAWTQTGRLTDPRGAQADRFGTAVAMADGVIIASSPGKDHGGQGTVIGFSKGTSSWVADGVFPTPVQEKSPAFAGSPRFFGASLSMAGSMASVLSTAGPAAEHRSYLFHRRGGRWLEIKPSAGVNENNATSNANAVGGNRWFVGRPGVDTDAGVKTGEVRIYDITSGLAIYDGPTVFSPEITAFGGADIDVGDLVAGKSYKRSFTFQNLTTETLTVIGLEVIGFEDEVLTGGEGLEELPPNASVTVTLTYKPSAEGFWQAGINLDTFGSDFERTSINLSALVVAEADGEGAFAVLNADPSTLVRFEDFLELESIPFGTQAITFNWTRNGSPVGGSHQRLLRLPAMTPANVGVYRLNVSNAFGSATTAPTSVAMYYERPDTDTLLVEGKTAKLEAPVVGPGVTYQWRFNNNILSDGADYSGTSTKTLVIKSAKAVMSGQYHVILNPGLKQVIPQRWNTTVLGIPVVTNPLNFLANLSVSQPVFTRFDTNHPATSFKVTGVIPPGLSVNRLTGIIAGQPTTPGTYVINVVATNAAGTTPRSPVDLSKTYTINVAAIPSVTLTNLLGHYAGTIARHSTNKNLGGRVTMSITGQGATSYTLFIGTKTVRSTGQIAAGPGGIYQQVVVVQQGLVRDTYVIKVDPATGRLSGTVAFGSQQLEEEVFSGWKRVWSATNPANSWIDVYTAALSPAAPIPITAHPGGTSYGRAVVDSVGGITMAGRVADGTSYTVSTFISPTQGTMGADFVDAPMHVLLHGNVGSLLGNLRLGHSSSALAGFHAATGTFSWMKGATAASRSYKAGFASHDLTVTGGKYVAPVGLPIINIPSRGTPNAKLDMAGAKVSDSLQFALIDDGFNVTNANVGSFPAPNTLRNTISIDAANGTFSGTLVLRDPNPSTNLTTNLDRTVKYYGVILSGLNQAVGHFNLAELPNPLLNPPTTSSNSPILSGTARILALP
ncbi:MAG: hypothetical protein JNJ83_07280 [Verrucomicrobiaceae bacterium]|nr:hypothetical protein [Verrucomicrobiaceae bacterium]